MVLPSYHIFFNCSFFCSFCSEGVRIYGYDTNGYDTVSIPGCSRYKFERGEDAQASKEREPERKAAAEVARNVGFSPAANSIP
jgi:hypothetical protein